MNKTLTQALIGLALIAPASPALAKQLAPDELRTMAQDFTDIISCGAAFPDRYIADRDTLARNNTALLTVHILMTEESTEAVLDRFNAHMLTRQNVLLGMIGPGMAPMRAYCDRVTVRPSTRPYLIRR